MNFDNEFKATTGNNNGHSTNRWTIQKHCPFCSKTLFHSTGLSDGKTFYLWNVKKCQAIVYIQKACQWEIRSFLAPVHSKSFRPLNLFNLNRHYTNANGWINSEREKKEKKKKQIAMEYQEENWLQFQCSIESKPIATFTVHIFISLGI